MYQQPVVDPYWLMFLQEQSNLQKADPQQMQFMPRGVKANQFCATDSIASAALTKHPVPAPMGYPVPQAYQLVQSIQPIYGPSAQLNLQALSVAAAQNNAAKPSAFCIDFEGEKYNLTPVPDFIRKELSYVQGIGAFLLPELMITLLFAHELLSVTNYSRDARSERLKRGRIYSIIKRRMGDRRSRTSIRRKVEKIVTKDTGVAGGLLKSEKRIQQSSKVLWNKLIALLLYAELQGTPENKAFAQELRSHVNTYLEANHANFVKSGLEFEKAKKPDEYTKAETESLFDHLSTTEMGFKSGRKD